MQLDRKELLLAGNSNSLLFKFSIPAMVAMLVNALYSVVGMIFVGLGVGALAITALSQSYFQFVFKEIKTFDKLMLESVSIGV